MRSKFRVIWTLWAVWLVLVLLFAVVQRAQSKPVYTMGFDNPDAPAIVLGDSDPLKGTLYQFPYPLIFKDTYLSPKGGCFRRADGRKFDSFAYSSKTVFGGIRSWRNEIQTNYPNPKGLCQFGWVQLENKNRNEVSVGSPVAGNDKPTPWGELANGAPGQWYALALYIPSNEGTFPTWINRGQNSIILQHMGSGNSSTPEIHWILGGKNNVPYITVAMDTSDNPDREDLKRTEWKFNVEPDRWHTFLTWWVRDWDSDGKYILWMDCPDWNDQTTCTPIINRQEKVSIRDKPKGSFSFGLYDSYVNTGAIKVTYWDSLVISDEDSTWAQAAAGLKENESVLPPVDPTTPEKPKPPTWNTVTRLPQSNQLELTWNNPTQRVDGEPLGSADIKQTNVYYSCNGKEGQSVVAGSNTTFLAGLPTVETCVYTLATVDQQSQVSDKSAAYTFDPTAAPQKPRNVRPHVLLSWQPPEQPDTKALTTDQDLYGFDLSVLIPGATVFDYNATIKAVAGGNWDTVYTYIYQPKSGPGEYCFTLKTRDADLMVVSDPTDPTCVTVDH